MIKNLVKQISIIFCCKFESILSMFEGSDRFRFYLKSMADLWTATNFQIRFSQCLFLQIKSGKKRPIFGAILMQSNISMYCCSGRGRSVFICQRKPAKINEGRSQKYLLFTSERMGDVTSDEDGYLARKLFIEQSFQLNAVISNEGLKIQS